MLTAWCSCQKEAFVLKMYEILSCYEECDFFRLLHSFFGFISFSPFNLSLIPPYQESCRLDYKGESVRERCHTISSTVEVTLCQMEIRSIRWSLNAV